MGCTKMETNEVVLLIDSCKFSQFKHVQTLPKYRRIDVHNYGIIALRILSTPVFFILITVTVVQTAVMTTIKHSRARLRAIFSVVCVIPVS